MQVNKMDEKQIEERAHELLNAMHMLRRTHFASKDDSGLKNSEKYILWLLATLNNGKPVMPTEAAKHLNVTIPAITHRINSLEKLGYVVRAQSPNDRRVILISLSDKGRQMVSKLKNSQFEKIRGLVQYLGDKDSSELISLITKISNYAKKTSEG